MRLLIAYDGSACSEAALDDLVRAGLPGLGEALVVSVAEIWLPPPGASADRTDETEIYVEEILARHRIKGQRLLNHSEIMAKHAAARVRKILPQWKVTSQADYGAPAWEILTAADKFGAALIVVGAQGHSMIGRLLLGSVSQKIVTEAACSVRIARGRIEVDPGPCRIMIGFDGSVGAEAAIDAVANRDWPSQSHVQIIAATDLDVPSSIGRFTTPPISNGHAKSTDGELNWLTTRIEAAGKRLKKAGLGVTSSVIEGDPNRVIIAEAKTWHADCIFVGANTDASRLSRFLLGTTSSAIAARAHCSVEVVRHNVAL